MDGVDSLENAKKRSEYWKAEALAANAVIDRLRGQLQNCVAHLERVKKRGWREDEEKILAAIESANRALYETL